MSVNESIDCVVIGAGVVGLAVARALALAGREVIVLERHARIGEEISSRNSEVIHAGLYYPSGSLKARLCVAGNKQLYAYCQSRSVDHKRCGKVIVAVDESQVGKLEALQRQGRDNGVHDLEWVDAKRLSRIEPNVRGVAGLWSPSTGIIDTHGLMQAFVADIESAGGIVATSSELAGGRAHGERIELTIASGGAESLVAARVVINAAGLGATRVARALGGQAIPETRYARGNYFSYQGASPFTHLVYPLPVPGGLGIHATLDLAGKLRFGPDVEWIDNIDYTVDAGRAAAFHEAIRTYWPAVRLESLQPSYAGVRPKISGPGEAAADFAILPAHVSGKARIVHLLGIESPGLTSSLAIADHVRDLVENRG
ncbi:MAG TPA: NAD(P)/FAD-dependent oxidoreductase [Gammaproteobacteria bacterium]